MLDVLVVEDHKEIGNLLCDFLENDGYVTGLATTGEQAVHIYEMYGARLVVLDICLPGMDGYAVCSRIRQTSNIPIIIVSAKSEKTDQLMGLELGADDYIEKPYDIDILLAKIRGIFKRKYELERLTDGDIELNTATATLKVGDKSMPLTAKECELLKLLMENRGTTMKKEYLFNSVWGSDSESEPQTLTVHIRGLREKIEPDPKNPTHITTVWGVGYRYE